MLDVSGLVITAVLNTKIEEVKNKIPSVSDLVEKTDYNAKKYQTLRQIILLLLIIGLEVTYLKWK